MSLRDAVAETLEGQTGWKVEMALALAAEVETKGTASAAKELRSLLAEIGADKPAAKPEGTVLSDFERRLAEREAKTSRRTASG